MSRLMNCRSILRSRLRISDPRELFSQLIAVLGLLLAAGGLFVSYKSMQKSDEIAIQALEISKASNEIALGTRKEPAPLEFSTYDKESLQFDLTDPSSLEGELTHVIRLSNRGRVPVSGISVDLIGIEPLTYSLASPGDSVRPLPSLTWKLDFNSAVLPSGAVAIDMRKPLLLYLQRLSSQLDEQRAIYITSINFVISTRALGDSDFMGAADASKVRDRELITVKFRPDIVSKSRAIAILTDIAQPHRVYTP